MPKSREFKEHEKRLVVLALQRHNTVMQTLKAEEKKSQEALAADLGALGAELGVPQDAEVKFVLGPDKTPMAFEWEDPAPITKLPENNEKPSEAAPAAS